MRENNSLYFSSDYNRFHYAKIYLVSGLGADERVFTNIEVPYSAIHLKWETPLHDEPISSYAKRLINQIDLTHKVILMGVSFGGIIAQEIAKLIEVEQVIIVSSVKSEKEFNWQFRLLNWCKVYRFIPSNILIWSNLLTADYYFGIRTKTESALLKCIIRDTDIVFMQWAINAIITWKNDSQHHQLYHIHGTKDKIFPSKNIENYIPIENGGHFMIYNKAKEINHIIAQILSI